ncbi:MAG: metallophosphoesterase [Anaerolineales bacterium]|nr:metallophosphoesterase [Anaerolineales bacterium]
MSSLWKRFVIVLIILCVFISGGKTPKAGAQSERIVFAVIGDFGLAGQPLLDVSNLIKSWNPDFIVTVGDNNYPDGAAETLDKNVGQYFHEYLIRYDGKYGSGSDTRRFYPALGNHDWVAATSYYFKYFGYYNPVTYYDFVQGPVHFFVLDSDRKEPDGVTANSPQWNWLRKSLPASTSEFNVVILHHAPYSSGKHGSTEYMRWPFKEWGADVVIAGHDHTYERLLVDGLPYFVNGIGGAELYPFWNILPESQVRFSDDYGAMRVEANDTTMKIQMFTRTGLLVDEYILGGTTPIVTSINSVETSPGNASLLNFQVAFSEPVTGVDVSDFSLATNISDAGIANVSGAGNLYTVAVHTGSGDGTLRLDLTDDDSVLNSLGIPLGGIGAANGNFSSGTTYSLDKTPPMVTSIMPLGASPTNSTSIDFGVSFSESVTGVGLDDFSLSTSAGATLINISGSGSNYTVSVATGVGDDALRLDFLDNHTVLDTAGNFTTAGFSNGGIYAVDRSAPVVTSVAPAGQPDASSVVYTVSFSEAVTGVDGGDFSLSTINGASIANITGAGNLYSIFINLQPGRDSVRLDVNANGSILDSVGNPLNGNFIGGTFNIAIETPIATSIIRASANPTNAGSVDFIVTFSEPVSGLDAGDFMLTSGASISNIVNSNPFYIVTVLTPNEGEVKLELRDDDSILNLQGVPLGGQGMENANFITGESFIIDRTPPQVTSIIRAGGNPSISPTADFIVTFSEPVNGLENGDFFIHQNNVILSSVLNVRNENPFYWVTTSTGAGSGSIRLDLIDNGNITDLAGNLLANNNFTLGESFSIAKTPIDFSAPTIINKDARTNDPSLPISWVQVQGAKAYEIIMARDASFSDIVFAQVLENTRISPPFPLEEGAYFVQVRAYDPTLSPGRWSDVYSFSVHTTLLPAPVLLIPKNGLDAARRPWLYWQAVDGAIKYEVQISRNEDFSTLILTATTNKTNLWSSKTLLSRPHYWRVRALDSSGTWGEWSQPFVFKVK